MDKFSMAAADPDPEVLGRSTDTAEHGAMGTDQPVHPPPGSKATASHGTISSSSTRDTGLQAESVQLGPRATAQPFPPGGRVAAAHGTAPSSSSSNAAGLQLPPSVVVFADDNEALQKLETMRLSSEQTRRAVWRPGGSSIADLIGEDSKQQKYYPESRLPLSEELWPLNRRFGLIFYDGQERVGGLMVYVRADMLVLRIQEFLRPESHRWFSTKFIFGVQGPKNYYSRTVDVDLRNTRAVCREGHYGVPRPRFEARPQEKIGANLATSTKSALVNILDFVVGGLGTVVETIMVLARNLKMLMIVLAAIPMALAWHIYATKPDEVAVPESLQWTSVIVVTLLTLCWYLLLSKNTCADKVRETTGLHEIDLAGFSKETGARWMRNVKVIALLSLACAALGVFCSWILFYEMTHKASEAEPNQVESQSQCPDKWCNNDSPDECGCTQFRIMLCMETDNEVDSKVRTVKPGLDFCNPKIHGLMIANVLFFTSTFAAQLVVGLLVWLNHRLEKLKRNKDNMMDYSEVNIFGCDVVNPSNQNIRNLASITLWSGDAEVLADKLTQFIHSEEHYALRAAPVAAR